MADDSYFDSTPSSPFDDDTTLSQKLAQSVSPASAQSLVGPPPDVAPQTQPGQTTPQTGTLATPPQQAVPKNLDTAQGRQSYNVQPAQSAQSPIGAVQPARSAQPVTQAQPQSSAQPVQPIQGATGSAQPVQMASMNPDPNASLRPGGSTSGPMPVMPAGSQPQVSAPSQLDTDTARRDAIVNAKPGWQNIQNPVGRVAGGIGNALLSEFAPGIASMTPGTTANYQQRLGVANQNLSTDTAQADTASQAAQRTAEAQKATAMAQSDAPITLSPEQASGINHPELAGMPMAPRTFSAMQVANTRAGAQEQVGAGHDVASAAKSGLTPDTDASGNKTYESDPNSPITQQKQAKTKLDQANAALAAAKNQEGSPYYKQLMMARNTAQQNANAAGIRAQAYMGTYLQRSKNVDLGGNVLPGAPIIQNGQGQGTVVGSGNANTAIKSQANVAQFNDVHGALDSLEGSAKALVQSGGKLNSPGVAAALAQPPGTLGKWLQGEGVKANLTKQERDYVIANAAAHENIQAMRKAAGGTATDSSVAKLDALIPGASTPDLDYFMRQTGQIRSTAQRLGSGVTTAAGGAQVRGGAAPANTPVPSGKAVSLAAARGLPQNKGRSDADITKDIQSHGHQVVP